MEAEVTNAITNLIAEKTILYPTDTVWGLGCDPNNLEFLKHLLGTDHGIQGKDLGEMGHDKPRDVT